VTLLLDTHTVLWFVEDAPALSVRAKAAIEDLDNTPTYSIASVWEMAIKVGLGKLAVSRPLYPEFAGLLQEHGFEQLGISYRHASEAGRLPWHHRDPFDRLLDRVGGDHAEDHRDARLKACLGDSTRHHATHVIVVVGGATDHGTEGDHRLVIPTRGHRLGYKWDFDGPRHPGHVYILGSDPVETQSALCTLKKAPRDEVVEAAPHQPNPQPSPLEATFESSHRPVISGQIDTPSPKHPGNRLSDRRNGVARAYRKHHG